MDFSARTLPSARGVPTALVLALTLAACAAPPPPRTLSPGEQCLADLGAHGVRYELAAVPASSGPCAVVNPVKVESAGVPWNQPAVMSCALADRVDRFFTEAVEPLARRHLGAAIARMDNFGAYSCRREVGQRDRRLGVRDGGRQPHHRRAGLEPPGTQARFPPRRGEPRLRLLQRRPEPRQRPLPLQPPPSRHRTLAALPDAGEDARRPLSLKHDR